MKRAAATVELRHPALEQTGGEALESAHLTDRQRVSMLLQAAALLSHLDFGGWRLHHGWAGATVDGMGRLRSITAEAGRYGQLPQTLMRDLALDLFQGEVTISGRGQARRAARRLLVAWEQTLTPVTADSMVEQVLDSAAEIGRCRVVGKAVDELDGEVVGPTDWCHLWTAILEYHEVDESADHQES